MQPPETTVAANAEFARCHDFIVARDMCWQRAARMACTSVSQVAPSLRGLAIS